MNIFGKKGSEAHQQLIEQLANQIDGAIDEKTGEMMEARKEYPVATPQEKRTFRLVDLAGLVEMKSKLKLVYMAQVGRTDKDGNPIKREQEAIEDLEHETEVHVHFYDYQTGKKIR